MAQISPKACLLMLFIIFQHSGTIKTACADQSTSAISAAILFGQIDPNSTQLAQLADQALNSDRILIGHRGSNELTEPYNPLRKICPSQLIPENTSPGKEESAPESSIANLLEESFETIRLQIKNTNQRIRPAFKPIEKIIQQQFEETVYDFCRQRIVPQLSSLNNQLRSTISDQWNQATNPANEDYPPARRSKSSAKAVGSETISNVQLVMLPAENGDDYWQYYQDCDRWEVTFSDLKAATQKANEMQIARQPNKTKAIPVSYRPIKKQTVKKSEVTDESALQQNSVLKTRLLQIANNLINDSKELAKFTTASIARLNNAVDRFAAVLEFQAVENFSTEYRLIKSENKPKVRVANQFDILAIGVGCISRAIKHSGEMKKTGMLKAEANQNDDPASNSLHNPLEQSISE